MAFEVVKTMQADGLEWDEDYRPFVRQALAEVIEEQMTLAVDRHLDESDAEDAADRRNGYYRRHLLTTLGDIELCVPRTRRYTPMWRWPRSIAGRSNIATRSFARTERP